MQYVDMPWEMNFPQTNLLSGPECKHDLKITIKGCKFQNITPNSLIMLYVHIKRQ